LAVFEGCFAEKLKSQKIKIEKYFAIRKNCCYFAADTGK
jgi:hypothetical protein